MRRKSPHLATAIEKNPTTEVGRIIEKYVLELFQLFSQAKDPRNQRYTTCSNRALLGQIFYTLLSINLAMSMSALSAHYYDHGSETLRRFWFSYSLS